jgi:hypothetical protein
VLLLKGSGLDIAGSDGPAPIDDRPEICAIVGVERAPLSRLQASLEDANVIVLQPEGRADVVIVACPR